MARLLLSLVSRATGTAATSPLARLLLVGGLGCVSALLAIGLVRTPSPPRTNRQYHRPGSRGRGSHRLLVAAILTFLLLYGPGQSYAPLAIGAVSLLGTMLVGGALTRVLLPRRRQVALALLVLLAVGSVGMLASQRGGPPLGAAPAAALVAPTPTPAPRATPPAPPPPARPRGPSPNQQPPKPTRPTGPSSPTTQAAGVGAIIDNGTIQLGVSPKGQLVVEGGAPSSGSGTTAVGLRYLPTNADVVSPGCWCEGWGAADATSDVTGYANNHTGIVNLTLTSFTATASSTTSVVQVGTTLKVTHAYRPAARTPNLYAIAVTLENIGGAPIDARYRRVMDWDVELTYFDEFVTAVPGTSAALRYNDNDGFATANPLASREYPAVSPLVTGAFTDVGPNDHGALFDFGFGTLAPGASTSFTLYYGAAGTEQDALAALSAVGVATYSLAQPNTPDGPTLGTPNTFIFGFTEQPDVAPLTVSPTSLSFGNQAIGSTSAAQTVTLTNTGSTALSISSISLTGTNAGDFAQTNACGINLAAGASCTISVTFTPTDIRTRSATLAIAETPGATPRTVALSGRGTPAPLMYVHGFKVSYRSTELLPIFGELTKEYPPQEFPNGIRNFQFYQDTGNIDQNGVCRTDGRATTPKEGIPVPIIASSVTICDSQSDLGANTVLLYDDMVTFFNETGRQRKVTLVCNSVGCSIVRGFLAYAMEMNARNPANPSALDLVDSVVFLEGMQAGSLLAGVGVAAQPPGITNPRGANLFYPLRELYRTALKDPRFKFDLSRPAAYNMSPGSDYYAWARQEYPPSNPTLLYTPPLAYFNVYGDIRLVEQACLLRACRDIGPIPVGDVAILPGPSSPYGTPWEGGARFLYRGTLGPDNWEWGMRRDIPYRVAINPLGMVSTVASLGGAIQQAYNAPEQHLNFGTAMATIPVEDCQAKQPIMVNEQVVKVVRGRLRNQHSLYACRP